MVSDNEACARLARTAADDKKGLDPLVLDVRGLSGVTDFYFLVTGTSTPHLKAIEGEITRRLKTEGVARYRESGTADSGWIVVDYLGVVVHIFTPERRAFYSLEKLWGDAPRLLP